MDILETYIEKFFNVDPEDGVRRRGMAKHGKPNFTTFREIVYALYHSKDVGEAAIKLHYGTTRRASDNEDAALKGFQGSMAKKRKQLGMPLAVALGKDNTKTWKAHIEQSVGYNTCTICEQTMPVENFKELSALESNKDKYKSVVYRNECHDCYAEKQNKVVRTYKKNNPHIINALSAKRRASKLERTPKWADLEAIKEIYRNCPEGHHVDHIIPLQGEKVSGLHVENNLQYLSAEENLRKSNKFE